jgi:hypothetical protein
MQTLTVDMFVSVDGWAGGATSPGYFGYFGPELEEWITTELALPHGCPWATHLRGPCGST